MMMFPIRDHVSTASDVSHTHTQLVSYRNVGAEQECGNVRNTADSGITHDGSDRTNCHPWPEVQQLQGSTMWLVYLLNMFLVSLCRIHQCMLFWKKVSFIKYNNLLYLWNYVSADMTMAGGEKIILYAENASETECTIIEHHNNKLHFKIEKKKVILNGHYISQYYCI